MWIIWVYGIGLCVISAFILGAWIVDWYINKKPNIAELLDFFKAFTATQVVAAFTFVSVFMVDKDNDGRPDMAEKDIDEDYRPPFNPPTNKR